MAPLSENDHGSAPSDAERWRTLRRSVRAFVRWIWYRVDPVTSAEVDRARADAADAPDRQQGHAARVIQRAMRRAGFSRTGETRASSHDDASSRKDGAPASDAPEQSD